MTRRHGAIISVLAVACCVAAAAMAAWYLLLVRLPDPATASRTGLFRWLVLRDVAAEPREVQVALVNRLQAELASGLAADGPGVPLGPAYRERLQANAEHLKRVWFTTRVDEYALVPADQQMAFLTEQIDAISRWTALDLSPARDEPGNSKPATDAAVAFFGQLEGWIEAASGEERERMLRAVQDGTVCWLATRDLAEQPRVIRSELAIRIVRELNAGMRLDEILLDLSPAEREKLFANGELLLEAWLHDQAVVFAALPEAERTKYLDARIDEVYKWGVLEVLAPTTETTGGTNTPTGAQTTGLLRLTALCDTWIERAPPDERANLVRLIAGVQRQIFWRQFRSR